MTNTKQELTKLLNNENYIQNPWKFLEEELTFWEKEGVIAEFWWRDDDATEHTEQLDKLIKTTEKTAINLAVIPNKLSASLIEYVENKAQISISVHGFNHDNHIPPGEKSCEFGENRDLDLMKKELQFGYDTLSKSFPTHFVPLFVPPWNRIGPTAVNLLPDVQLNFLSTFTARKIGQAPYLINTHIDPVNWRNEAKFIGEATAIAQALLHLRAKRNGWENTDPIEPTGFLTHHLIHDTETWSFCLKFNQFITNQPFAKWIDIKDYITSFHF